MISSVSSGTLSIMFSISPAIKSAFTASIGTPAPLKSIPVCPVPMNSTLRSFDFNLSDTSQAVVILPVSQSVPTINKTGIFLLCQEPFGKLGGSGGRLRSNNETLNLSAN